MVIDRSTTVKGFLIPTVRNKSPIDNEIGFFEVRETEGIESTDQTIFWQWL